MAEDGPVTSVITHGILAAGLRPVFPRAALPRRAWLAGVFCSVAPDLDSIGLRLGIPYGHFFGHRGFSHSLLFALVLSALGVLLFRRFSRRPFSSPVLGLYLLLCAASHGLLDGMTNGGLGIAFLSPFDTGRYFLPSRPLLVSPIGIGAFFSSWGWEVLKSEALWVWLPLTLLLGVTYSARRFRPRDDASKRR